MRKPQAIDAATPPQPGDTKPGIGLAYDFLQTFAQRLSFTPVSALEAYQAWIADLPSSAPSSYALLTAQQRSDPAGFIDVWKNAYLASFSSTGQPPAALSFERFLQNSPIAFSSIADAYSRWPPAVCGGRPAVSPSRSR